MIARLLVCLALVVGIDCNSSAYYYDDGPFMASINDVHLQSYLQTYYYPWFNQTIEFMRTLSGSSELGEQCRGSLKRWLAGLEEKEAWAIKLLEATGKTLNGKLIGRNINFGSFEFCRSFVRSERDNVDFNGKFCMVSVQTKESEIIRNQKSFQNYHKSLSDRSRRLLEFNLGNAHGVCLPSTCEIEELTSAANRIFKPIGFSVLPPSRCSTAAEREPITRSQIFSFSIILIFVSLCVASLFIENDFLSHFSLLKNWKIIYNTESRESKSEEQAYLHGAKALLVIASICTHSYLFMGLYISHPFASIKELNLDAYRAHSARATSITSQLFFVGGFFSFYAWYDVIKSKAIRFNYFTYLLTRYIRIAIINLPVLLCFFLLPHFGKGAFYSVITNQFRENCEENGFKVFLLSTNINDPVIDMCNATDWYLSADSQIYFLNFLLIYFLALKPRLGFLITFVQCLFFTVVQIWYRQKHNLPVFFNVIDVKIHDSFMPTVQNSYFPFFFHYNTYVIGILCAYLIRNEIKPKIMDNRLFRASIWVLLLVLNLLMTWYPWYLERNGLKASKLVEILYQVFDKVAVSLVLVWVFYCLAFGYLGLLRKFLSFKFWIPWSRMAFSLCYCQFIYIAYTFASTRSSYSYNFDAVFKEMLGNCVSIFILGNFIFLFFEAPMLSLFMKLTGLKRRSQIDKNQNSEQVADEQTSEFKDEKCKAE